MMGVSTNSPANNSAFGEAALTAITTGGNNSVFGVSAGGAITTGGNNTIIGYQVASTTLNTGSSNILIGTSSGVDTPAANTSSWLNIGNTIYGDLSNHLVAIGNGVSSITAGAALDLSSNTSSMMTPVGTTGQRPGTGVNGMVRYNSTNNNFEFYQNGAWTTYSTLSDRRLKTEIKPIKNPLEIAEALNPVTFKWDPKNPRNDGMDSKTHLGFIAQELEQVIPDVVDVGADSYRTVRYDKIVPVAIGAIKELKADNDRLQKKVAALEAKQGGSNEAALSVLAPQSDHTLILVVAGFGTLMILGLGGVSVMLFRTRRQLNDLLAHQRKH
jgi:hypothetical protein